MRPDSPSLILFQGQVASRPTIRTFSTAQRRWLVFHSRESLISVNLRSENQEIFSSEKIIASPLCAPRDESAPTPPVMTLLLLPVLGSPIKTQQHLQHFSNLSKIIRAER